jgi:hypoxia up-regulated 1
MVENTQSKTMTNNAVSFYDGDRLLEADSIMKQAKKPENTFTFIMKYFGEKDVAKPELQSTMERHFENKGTASNFSPTEGYQTIKFALDNFVLNNLPEADFPAKERFTGKTEILFEEIVAMILERASKLSDKYGKTSYPDAVYTVPPWWGPVEREQLAACGDLAGINALGLISENTGSIVKYAFERKEQAKLNVLLYNMGSSSTKLSVVSLEGQESVHFGKNVTKQILNVLGESWDTSLGAHELDLCFADMIAAKFDEKSKKPTVRQMVKNMLRITRESKKFKEILSANKFTMASIEELAYEIDFVKKFDRQEFEVGCAALFDRVTPPIEDVLAKSGLQKSDIDLIEIIGGGVRIPKVQDLIKNYMDKEVNMHLNGDDSMALGASLVAANLTTTFRVLVPELNDGPNYQTDVTIEGLAEDDDYKKSSTLLKPKQRYGLKKLLNLKHNQDIRATLIIPKVESSVALGDWSVTYDVKGVNSVVENPKHANWTNPTISLGFGMSYTGIPSLNKAELIMEEEYEVSVKYKKDATTTDAESAEKKEGEFFEGLKDLDYSEKKEGDATETPKDAESAEKKEGDATETPKDDGEYTVQEKRTRKHTYKLEVSKSGKSHPAFNSFPSLMSDGKKILKLFREYEEKKLKNAEAKNRLESLMYSIPEITEDKSLTDFGTEEELEKLRQDAKDLDDWFFEDEASTADYKVFNAKHDTLRKQMTRLEFRRNESEGREGLVQVLNARITQSSNNIGEMITTRPWIAKEKIDGALARIEEVKVWLDAKVLEQEPMSTREDPVLLSSVLNQKMNIVKLEYEQLRLIKKPIEKKVTYFFFANNKKIRNQKMPKKPKNQRKPISVISKWTQR